MANHFTGILLSGGESRRFGEPKAFYPFQNRPLYDYSLQSLKAVTEKVIIVSRPEDMNHYQSVTDALVLQDNPNCQGMGPLAGIYTAMAASESEWYIVLPCDTPFITAAFLRNMKIKLAELVPCDGIVPISGGYEHPLTACYHRRCLPVIENLLQNNDLRMDDLLKSVNIHYTCPENDGFAPKLFDNMNRKEQLYKEKDV